MVRRLPVIQTKASEDEAAEQRPPTHWVVITAGLTLTLWVPLALVALSLGRRLAASIVGARGPAELTDVVARASGGARAAVAMAVMLPTLLSFFLACLSAGAIVGRFGGRCGVREAALGTGLGALAAWALAAAGGSLGPWPVAAGTAVVLVAAGGLAGAWGGKLGDRRRPRA